MADLVNLLIVAVRSEGLKKLEHQTIKPDNMQERLQRHK